MSFSRVPLIPYDMILIQSHIPITHVELPTLASSPFLSVFTCLCMLEGSLLYCKFTTNFVMLSLIKGLDLNSKCWPAARRV